MRALIAYLFALLAVATGLWFGYLRRGATADAGEQVAKAAQAVPVILAPVVEAPFAERLLALGTARANESVQLTVNRSELVAAVHFEDGQRVAAGQLLLELATAEEQAMMAEAKALCGEREAEHRRQLDLNRQGIAPDSLVQTALAQLEAARARVQNLAVAIADHEVRAPFAGVLGLRRVSVGALLQPSTVITTLDDLTTIKVDFTVPETWLAAVQVGQAVVARADALPGRDFPGAVTAIDTRLDPTTRSATVRALVPNGDGLLRPGMLIKVEVDRGEAPSLQVPEEALVQRGDRHFVYLVGADRVAREVEVGVGRRRVGSVEVVRGLEVDQQVVVEGIVRVRDGMQVQVVEVRGGGA